LEREIERVREQIEARSMIGECMVSGDRIDSGVVHFANVSHLVTRLWLEGDDLMAEIETMQTPMGKVVEGMLQEGVNLRLGLRGVGTLFSLTDDVSYKLITVDFWGESLGSD
jgi:hypothetical protein